jgi:hypothetical protein
MTNKIKLSIFWLARASGMFALSRRLTGAKVRILCYHGGCLGDESSYNPKLFCSSATLARRMQWLKNKGFDLVTLTEATTRMRTLPAGRPRLTTAITFDDGWYSTASELVPVLGQMNIPSTLYLCTSHFVEGWSVPSVAVRYLIWKSGLQRAQLHGFGEGIDGDADLSTSSARNAVANALVAAIDRAPAERAAKHALLEQLAACLEVPSSALQLASRRFAYMNPSELLKLPAQQCEIELHGHIHHYPAGDIDRFTADLKVCRDTIVAAGLPTPTHYCYPSGNFDSAASAALEALQVSTATTCLPGLVTHATPTECHYLPRFLDGESVSTLEFEAEMSGFSDILRRLLRRSNQLQPA